MLHRWDPWYASLQARPYGPPDTYRLAAAWLEGLAVEDWGCGCAEFSRHHKGPYKGIDGSAGWADTVADLGTYTSETDGILLRHVLEHNEAWERILGRALRSFTKRMALVLFTPDSGSFEAVRVGFVPELGVPDLALPFRAISAAISASGAVLRERVHVPTLTGYGGETVWYIEKS
jgi:hypothetical protein